MKINGIKINENNLEDFYEFDKEVFLGRTDTSCGFCNGTGKYANDKCSECDGNGEIWADGERDDHQCTDWDSEDIDFVYDNIATINRTCEICHQLSQLVFYRKKE